MSVLYFLKSRKVISAMIPTVEVATLYSKATAELKLVRRNPKIESARNEQNPMCIVESIPSSFEFWLGDVRNQRPLNCVGYCQIAPKEKGNEESEERSLQERVLLSKLPGRGRNPRKALEVLPLIREYPSRKT